MKSTPTLVLVAFAATALAQGCLLSSASRKEPLPSWAVLLRTNTDCEETFVECLSDGTTPEEDCVEALESCLDAEDPYNGLFGDLATCDRELGTCLDAIYSQIPEDEPCGTDDDEEEDEETTCTGDPEAAFEEEEELCFAAYDECYDPMTCRLQDIEELGTCYAEFYDDPELGVCFETLDECLLTIVAEDPYLEDEEVASREEGCFDNFNGCAGIVLPHTEEHEECEELLAECLEVVNLDPTLPADIVDAVVEACGLVYEYCLECGVDEDDCEAR